MQTEDVRGLMDDIRKRAQPKVVIGISAYNIEGSIEKIVTSLNTIADEVIVCDDASTDTTAKIAQTLNCKVISHPHHLGPGATTRSLFLAADRANADVLLTVSTEMLCDADDLTKLADSVARREADIVIGSRFALKPVSSTENFDRSILTVYGLPVQDPKSPFRAYSKGAVSTIVAQSLEKPNILPAAKKLDLGLMESAAPPMICVPENPASGAANTITRSFPLSPTYRLPHRSTPTPAGADSVLAPGEPP